VLDVLDNADAALELTARKTIALVHRTNRGLMVLEAVPRGGRYFIMRSYRLAASRFERVQARTERLGGTTYLRPSARDQAATPVRGLNTEDSGSGEAQQSRTPLAGETARVTPTNEGPADVSATRSKSNPDNDGLTRSAVEERAALESLVLRAVEQVAGPEAAQRTATPDRISERPGRDWNLGHDQGQYESAGAYYPGREQSGVFPLIAVALADNPDAVRAAYHDGWHPIEGTLTKTEIAILRRETPRLRKQVIAQRPDLAGVAGKAEAEEIWAEAAANHAIGQANGESGRGIHIAVRRIFAKITRLLARIRNAVAGLGFQTSEDIFESFARGEMAVRRQALPADMRTRWWRPETDEARSSVRRRGANITRPPARPPDKAETESDRKNSGARASGPSSLKAKEQRAPRFKRPGLAISISAKPRSPIASASAATKSAPTAAAKGGPKLIGSFKLPAGLQYSGTDFGKYAHRKIGSMLRHLYKGVGLILRVEPGQQGIDVSVPTDSIAKLGFAHAEIKPLSESGERKLRQQVWKWGYKPSTVRAITYDANGNVYFGFR
jgi:hypothetical protein